MDLHRGRGGFTEGHGEYLIINQSQIRPLIASINCIASIASIASIACIVHIASIAFIACIASIAFIAALLLLPQFPPGRHSCKGEKHGKAAIDRGALQRTLVNPGAMASRRIRWRRRLGF